MQLNGRYRLDAQIGAGGMSTVYRAFDSMLERRVAVKLMHREIAADSDQLERFRREARAVAQLSHPHIVGVIDAGEEDGRPYIVFEYVEGETLKDRIRRMGRLPVDEAIAYAIEIARALGAAHARHIVHRDVKPQNVLIDEEGSAKVTDFGIARSLDDDEGLTADGRVLGTTDYVSPEQALGHDVNGQSDIYSLGVVLYEMLTGDVPFHGENQVAVAMKHVREDLPDVQTARARRLRGPRGDPRPHDRQAPRAPLPRRRARSRSTSRTRSPPRPPAQGRATGEATAVIAHAAGERAAPPPAAGCAARSRSSPSSASLLLGGARRCSSCCSRASSRTQRGTGQGRTKPPAGSQGRLRQAHERAGLRPARRPRRARRRGPPAPSTRTPAPSWTTESYSGDTLAGQGGRRPLRRRRARRQRHPDRDRHRRQPAGRRRSTSPPTATHRPPPPARPTTGQKVGGGTVRRKHQRFKLRTDGKRYRYYLVWITKLPRGPGARRDLRGHACSGRRRP